MLLQFTLNPGPRLTRLSRMRALPTTRQRDPVSRTPRLSVDTYTQPHSPTREMRPASAARSRHALLTPQPTSAGPITEPASEQGCNSGAPSCPARRSRGSRPDAGWSALSLYPGNEPGHAHRLTRHPLTRHPLTPHPLTRLRLTPVPLRSSPHAP